MQCERNISVNKREEKKLSATQNLFTIIFLSGVIDNNKCYKKCTPWCVSYNLNAIYNYLVIYSLVYKYTI